MKIAIIVIPAVIVIINPASGGYLRLLVQDSVLNNYNEYCKYEPFYVVNEIMLQNKPSVRKEVKISIKLVVGILLLVSVLLAGSVQAVTSGSNIDIVVSVLYNM